VDVVAPADGLDEVVAVAAQDAVVAHAGDDVIIARAGVDHHVHGDVRRGLDDVVAVAGADGQLLALAQANFVDLAVDVDVQRAIVALADADMVIALPAGGEHHLVTADTEAGDGLLPGHRGLLALVQLGVADGLAIGGALVGQAGAGIGTGDGDGAVPGTVIGLADGRTHVAAQRGFAELLAFGLPGAIPVVLAGLVNQGRRLQ